MNFTTYRLAENSEGVPVIVSEQVGAVEIACYECGARWLRCMAPLVAHCPYCDSYTPGFDKSLTAALLAEVVLAEQGQAAYGRDLRGVARALWNGSLDFDQAFGMFDATIRLGLTHAWHRGAKECGIMPGELTAEERQALQDAIYSESGRVFGFLTYIEQNDEASGGKFGPILSRVSLWSNRYLDVVNRAKMRACGNLKVAWRLGPTKTHCVDCSNLSGKVKRASQFERAGIHPQSPALACGGLRCLCFFEPTDEPMSKGPLPRLRGRA